MASYASEDINSLFFFSRETLLLDGEELVATEDDEIPSFLVLLNSRESREPLLHGGLLELSWRKEGWWENRREGEERNQEGQSRSAI